MPNESGGSKDLLSGDLQLDEPLDLDLDLDLCVHSSEPVQLPLARRNGPDPFARLGPPEVRPPPSTASPVQPDPPPASPYAGFVPILWCLILFGVGYVSHFARGNGLALAMSLFGGAVVLARVSLEAYEAGRDDAPLRFRLNPLDWAGTYVPGLIFLGGVFLFGLPAALSMQQILGESLDAYQYNSVRYAELLRSTTVERLLLLPWSRLVSIPFLALPIYLGLPIFLASWHEHRALSLKLKWRPVIFGGGARYVLLVLALAFLGVGARLVEFVTGWIRFTPAPYPALEGAGYALDGLTAAIIMFRWGRLTAEAAKASGKT